MTKTERTIYDLIHARTSAAPITIRQIWYEADIGKRRVIEIVKKLRQEYPIGSRRGRNPGYYWCITADEIEDTTRPIWRQAMSELVTVARLRNKPRLLRMLGQLELEELK